VLQRFWAFAPWNIRLRSFVATVNLDFEGAASVANGNGNFLEWMARAGYGARGLVYALVGGLALLAALGTGGQTGGSRSALQTLLGQPFGKVILGIVALGLAFFAAWRLFESVSDADHRGSSGKALATRAARAMSGLIYIGLAFSTLGLVLGWGSGGGEDRAAQDWTAWLLAKPFGQWGVALIGVAVGATGFGYLRRAWTGEVLEDLTCPSDTRRWVVPLGRLGFGGRGVVFVLIGGFLLLAALHSNSSEVKGLGGALETLQQQPYGWALLAVTAAGLLAFGLFGFVQAIYRRIDTPDLSDAGDAIARGVQGAQSLRPPA
jgi:hypothetical protein